MTNIDEIKARAKQMKELADNAAHGPWLLYRRDDVCGLIRYDIEQENMQRIAFGVDDTDLPKAKQTSEFIAASRENVPYAATTILQLCNEIERLKSELAEKDAVLELAFKVLREAQTRTAHMQSKYAGKLNRFITEFLEKYRKSEG